MEMMCIECSNQSGRFTIAETTFASITSLCFIGCGYNIVFQVEQFTVEGSTFLGVEGRVMYPMIELWYVASAKISNTLFQSNAYNSSLVRGVIYAKTSSFTVTHCVFTDINASFAGVILAFKSTFNFIDNVVSDINVVSGGGVIATHGSSSNISNSTFTDNFANPGGVIISQNSI